ncbi:IS110 family transposase [Clostridium sp. D2Q-14]|nr:IS110 family transposase [Anaeromonas gelatinilytica]
MGPVLASGILLEIGTIKSFNSQDALAKYAGLTWRVNQSGNYTSGNTRITKNQLYSNDKVGEKQ